MTEPWEAHARWWQDEFTDGVDPEYTEQILPLADEWLAGRRRVPLVPGAPEAARSGDVPVRPD